MSTYDDFGVYVYADGFGNWHAEVIEYGIAAAEGAERLARKVITAAIVERNGSDILTGIRLVQRTSQNGSITSHYEECDATDQPDTAP